MVLSQRFGSLWQRLSYLMITFINMKKRGWEDGSDTCHADMRACVDPQNPVLVISALGRKILADPQS